MMTSLRPALVATTRAALGRMRPSLTTATSTSSCRRHVHENYGRSPHLRRWQQQQQHHHHYHHHRRCGRRHITTSAAVKGKKSGGGGDGGTASGLLSGIHPESIEACTRIIERAQAACDKWSVDYTEFLDPALAEAALTCVGRMADCEARAWGGYERAERVRLVFGRPEVLDGEDDGFAAVTDESNGIVALLEVQGNFLFDKADHRDFLGATLGAGIQRDRVGDILVQGERGAQILTTPEMATFLRSAMTSVRSVPVTVTRTSISELRVPPSRVDTFTSIEASMRLDAVASAGGA